MRTHAFIDNRSLALHRLIASKIRSDPTLFGRVQETLSRWRTTVCPSSLPYIEEWGRLVKLGMEPCLKVAEEDSPRAIALRQSSPFVGILTHGERFEFLRNWSQHHEES